MKAWALVVLTACAAPPTTPPEPDPLELQHQLSQALDSADRAKCGAPVGCRCKLWDIDCPDFRPPAPEGI